MTHQFLKAAAVALSLLSNSAWGAPPAGLPAPEALLVDQLKAKGFVCKPVASSNSDLCTVGSISQRNFSYPNAVGIVVPKGTRRPANVLMHFHGFQNVCRGDTIKHPAGILSDFNLVKQMEQNAPASTVMVVPVSYGKIATFKSHLLPKFAEFRQWVDASVKPAQNAQWIFSGHSAGGYAINHALRRDPALLKNVRGIALLDATYWSDRDTLNQWKKTAAASPALSIHSVYKSGTPTASGSVALKSAVRSANLTTTGERHCGLVNTHLGKMLKGMRLGAVAAPAPAVKPVPLPRARPASAPSRVAAAPLAMISDAPAVYERASASAEAR